MKQKRVLAGLGLAGLAVLAGCAAPGYGGGYGAGYGGGGGYAPAPAYGGQPQQSGALYGRVESIEPMQAPANSPGILGTIIGGVAGGVLGQTRSVAVPAIRWPPSAARPWVPWRAIRWSGLPAPAGKPSIA